MESTLMAANAAMSKTLNPGSNTTPLISLHNRQCSGARRSQLAYARLSNRMFNGEVWRLNRFGSVSLSRGLAGVDLRVDCVGSSAGGGFGGDDGSGGNGGGGGGGGDGAAEGGEGKPAAAAAALGAEDVSALSSDVIILDVKGMSCGGCAGKVKRILESQPQVASASVDLATETALVWPVSEAKVEPNWQKQLGEALANHLTSCGFQSKLKGFDRTYVKLDGYLAGQGANEGDVSS